LKAIYHDKVLWQYHYASDQEKPFFHPVALPDGRVLTANRPPDHPWHHALWFSWKFLNGVNYWEVDRQTGKSEGQTKWTHSRIETRPDGSARLETPLSYFDPSGQSVLCEVRHIEVSAPDPTGQYQFDWACTFTAGPVDVTFDRTPLPNEPGGEAYGGYAGLSVRLATDLVQRQATTDQAPVEFNRQSRYRGKARAMDYNGQIDGAPAGIAICDHPQNLNHPSPWYAIRSDIMSYYSPAVICYGPYRLPAGQSFTLRYRVIVHPDRWSPAELTDQYERFIRDSDGDRPGEKPR
jgi:hypothetical protein